MKSLSTKQVAHLESLGFEWDPIAALWEDGYQALVAYREKHGDCLVPQGKGHLTSQGNKLGTWVKTQRRAYKNGNLTAEQIARLDELGFDWDPFATGWEEGYQAFGCGV